MNSVNIGKTRLVQALFEKINDGDTPLEPQRAFYTDTGLDPNPSISDMLENLSILEQEAFLVVDNCSAELHSQLASKRINTNVKQITVEYDIRDDEPEKTDIVRIEANGTAKTTHSNAKQKCWPWCILFQSRQQNTLLMNLNCCPHFANAAQASCIAHALN